MASLDELARTGLTAIAERKFDEAITAFTAALAIDGDRPDLNHALGSAYLHRGEVGSALPYLEKAVLLAKPFIDPRHQDVKVSFHLGLAAAYEAADRTPDSLRVLRDAVSQWPDRIEPRLQLAQLLLQACQLEQGLAEYKLLADHPKLDKETQAAAKTVVDAVRAFVESDHPPSVFLQGHAESYVKYFDEATADSIKEGWFAEAARMARGPDGEPRPIVPQGARPYAMQRIDLVNPADGTAASVYSEQEPMVVALNGLEPLAQLPIMLPWKDQGFPVFVCTRCPWHWLSIVVQFDEAADEETRIKWIDDVIGNWYLAGFNGDFGDKDAGRFHFITDPEPLGDRAVSYTVDLGRARYDAINALMSRFSVVNDTHRIRRVLFGQGRLPD